MNEEKDLLKEKTSKKYKLRMTFSIVILAALFIVELYLMMNYSNGYLAIGIIGLVMLCFVYLITDLNFKMRDEKEALYQEQYESIYKAEKVSYVLIKQSFMELEETLEKIKENSDFPVEELIRVQKGVAKVSIQRSKENAVAIMNCNNQLLDYMLSFEENIKEINRVIEERQNDTSLQLNQEMIAKQQEVISYVNRLEDFIKKEFSDLTIRMESKQQEISAASLAPAAEEMSTEELEKVLNEASALMESMDMEIPSVEIPEEPVITGTSPAAENPIIPEANVAAEEPAAAPSADSNHIMTPEEIAALIGGVDETPIEPEKVIKPEEPTIPEEIIVPEEPVISESIVVPEEPVVQESISVPEEPVIQESISVPEEPVITATAPSSDPNHIMTPDEIAALLGETSAVAEEPEPVVEEKPVMPDLSNPNHVMTPEEIAALLANM